MATTERFEFEELKQMCVGRWQEIISALASVDISEAQAKLGRHVKCHNNHGRTLKQFRLFSDFHETGGGVCNTCGSFPNGFLLLTHLNGYDSRTAVKEVANYMRDRHIAQRPSTPQQSRVLTKPVFTVDNKKVGRLKRTWSDTVPLSGTIGERYLRDRGIGCELPDENEIRFHPGLGYFDDEGRQLGVFPAILSLLRSCEKGYPLSIHRIYLDPKGGKANVPEPKKLMSVPVEHAISQLGAAIRLFSINADEIAITEGIETALAVRSLWPQLPVWATYSANVLTKFTPPKGVNKVYIYGDVDPGGAGQAAAATLALRLYDEGVQAFIRLPLKRVTLPPDGSGWFNDQVTREKIVWRLSVDGYSVSKSCEGKDHLDALVEKQKSKHKQSA